MKTTGQGWINAYYENKLDDLPLGYIKKVETLFTEMRIEQNLELGRKHYCCVGYVNILLLRWLPNLWIFHTAAGH